jgi:hypothetical protein
MAVMIRSLASVMEDKDWAFVAGNVKKFLPSTNTYLLSDGSIVKRVDNKVVFHDDGIHVRALNKKREN